MRWPERFLNAENPLSRGMLTALVLLSHACFSTGEGLDPPVERIYFPVGLAVDKGVEGGANHLVVVNSDYDLQYNAGTLQVLDLQRARTFIPVPCATDTDCSSSGERRCDVSVSSENGGIASGVCVDAQGAFAGLPCGAIPERSPKDQLLYPGRCDVIDPAARGLIRSAIEIGAFATDVIYRPRMDAPGEGRIFIPVRGDATLHWADLRADGSIDCGQRSNSGGCDDRHRVGDDADQENSRDLRLGAEPFAIDASPDGEAIVVTHQGDDSVALFRNPANGTGPELEFSLGLSARRPVGVAALPAPAVVSAPGSNGAYTPGFLVTFRGQAQVNLLRYLDDAAANHERPYLTSVGASGILLNSNGQDSRGIAVDDSVRRRAEEACVREGLADDALRTCLERAAGAGLDVYVASRSPESLLIGRTNPAVNEFYSTELPSFYASIPLPLGPSRVVVGEVIVGGSGEDLVRETRVFVVCFDSRRIVVYDPRERHIETEITTGRGPHAVAVDATAGHLFVGHFTDSFVGVVSLDRRFPRTYGTMIATIGKPTAPRASK